jgi:predicted nucleotidyltransferase
MQPNLSKVSANRTQYKEYPSKNKHIQIFLCKFAYIPQTTMPMISNNVQEMIPKIQQFFKSQPIEKAWLFGSCSRGEETPTSDVDILVRYKRDDKFSLMTISRIMAKLGDLLTREVDLVEEGRLLPFAQKSVEQDKLLIYERES